MNSKHKRESTGAAKLSIEIEKLEKKIGKTEAAPGTCTRFFYCLAPV